MPGESVMMASPSAINSTREPRPRPSGAVRDDDLAAMHLTRDHQRGRVNTQCAAPDFAHRPGAFFVARRREANICLGQSLCNNAAGYAVPNAAERLEQRALPERHPMPPLVRSPLTRSNPARSWFFFPGGIDDHAIDKPFNRREVIGVWLHRGVGNPMLPAATARCAIVPPVDPGSSTVAFSANC